MSSMQIGYDHPCLQLTLTLIGYDHPCLQCAALCSTNAPEPQSYLNCNPNPSPISVSASTLPRQWQISPPLSPRIPHPCPSSLPYHLPRSSHSPCPPHFVTFLKAERYCHDAADETDAAEGTVVKGKAGPGKGQTVASLLLILLKAPIPNPS